MERSESELEGAKSHSLALNSCWRTRLEVRETWIRRRLRSTWLIPRYTQPNTAQQLKQLVAELDSPGGREKAMPLPLTSPQSGTLRNVSVTRGQTVTAGTILFEIVDMQSMWVRVPIYVNLLPDICIDREARVVGLDGRAGAQPLAVRRLPGRPRLIR